MGDQSFTSEMKRKKRKVIDEEPAAVEEYSRLQKPYHIIRQHIIPCKRINQQHIARVSNEGRNFVKHRKAKRQHTGYSTVVDHHLYRISLFDITPDSATPCKKKEKDGGGLGYSGVLKWEKELISDHVDALKAMFEFKQIYFFIHKKKKMLNFSDVPLFIVERMFLMPRESTHLASVMTALLNHCFHLKGYSADAPMPYVLWNSYLQMKVGEWYDIVASFGGDTMAATNYIGFEHDFFVICGPANPLKFCDFHYLNLLQRVWLVKSLCDSLMLDDEEASEEETDSEDNENFDCPWLGTDRHGRYYFYLSYFNGQENLRVYRLYKYCFPVAGSFYDRIHRENRGQVSPCKKYHELLADDIQSLRRLASEFAEPLETEEETSSQMQNFGTSDRPDCESRLHQKLLDLLSEMEPLESKLMSLTLKMLMLLKSDWDRYHGDSLSSGNQHFKNGHCNHGNKGGEARNSLDEKSYYPEDSRPASPVQHFLVSMVKSKKNILQLKRIVPRLRSAHKCCDLNLPNVHITPLKKLSNGSQSGVEILTASESENGCGSAKQIVVCNNKLPLRNDETTEDSGSDDSVMIVDSDIAEDNVLDTTFARSLIHTKSCGHTPLYTHSCSPVKTADEEIEWEALSDSSTNSFEMLAESSNRGVSEKVSERNKSFSSVFNNVHTPLWNASKQASSYENGTLEIGNDLHPKVSKCTEANKRQPLVIRIGGSRSGNTTHLSSHGKNQDENVLQDVQRPDGPVSKRNTSKEVSSQPEISALSEKCSAGSSQRSSRIHTARKSFVSSRRQLLVRENTSKVDHRELLAPENISGDPRSSGTNISVKHVVPRSQEPVRSLKAVGTPVLSEEAQNSSPVTQIMRFPIVSSSASPIVRMSNGSAYLIVSPKKIASCHKTMPLSETSPPKIARSVGGKLFVTTGKTARCFNHPLTGSHSDFTSPSDAAALHGNKSHSTAVLEEDECVEVVSESVNSSNQKICTKSFPISQQLIYTLSPMETSFTIRNSLETRISATKDRVRVCDSGKNILSQENKYLCSSDMLSGDFLADNNAKKRKIDNKNSNTPLPKSVLKSSSALISSAATVPVTCILSSTSELSEKSQDSSKFSRAECLKKSAGASLLSHRSTTVINLSESRSDVSKDSSAEFAVATCSDFNEGSTELIPVVLPDGKNILLRLVNSQSASTKTSLLNNSSQTSQEKNITPQTVSTKSSKKSANCNNSHIPVSQSVSTLKVEVSQISSSSTLTANSPSREDLSLADDVSLGDSESNTTDGKFANQDSSSLSEMLQKCTSNSVTPVSASVGKVGKRMTYAQKIEQILKSSEACGDVIIVEKIGDVEKSKSAKRNLPPQPKTTCQLNPTMLKVKKVEIPVMANRILSNLSLDGNVPVETLSGSTSISLCSNNACTQVEPANSGSTGFTGPVNQATGNTVNILNTGGASGGIIILGQPQLGNNTIFTQPASSVNQTSLLLVPPVASTPFAPPLTSPVGFTAPLLSSAVSLEPNGVVSPSVPNSQPLVLLCQNQFYMVPPMITSNTLPVITPMPPNPLRPNNSDSYTGVPATEDSSVTTSSTNFKSNVENEGEAPTEGSTVTSSTSSNNTVENKAPTERSALSSNTNCNDNVEKEKENATESSSVTESTNCNDNTESTNCNDNTDEAEDSWVIVPDPLELRKAELQKQKPWPQSMSRTFTLNFFPNKKENAVVSSSGQTLSNSGQTLCSGGQILSSSGQTLSSSGLILSSSGQILDFPGNRELPVVASNKKATEKYDLSSRLRRPPLTLDEPITVIPSRKQDMLQQ